MSHNDYLVQFFQDKNLIGFVASNEYSPNELQCKILYYDQSGNKVEVVDIVSQSSDIENLLQTYQYRLTYKNTPENGTVLILTIENR